MGVVRVGVEVGLVSEAVLAWRKLSDSESFAPEVERGVAAHTPACAAWKLRGRGACRGAEDPDRGVGARRRRPGRPTTPRWGRTQARISVFGACRPCSAAMGAAILPNLAGRCHNGLAAGRRYKR